jgi:hypothetical protein
MVLDGPSLRMDVRNGVLKQGGVTLATIAHLTLEMGARGTNEFRIEADKYTTDPVYWPFRDPNQEVILEMTIPSGGDPTGQIKRERKGPTTARYQGHIWAENPIRMLAKKIASDETSGDMW